MVHFLTCLAYLMTLSFFLWSQTGWASSPLSSVQAVVLESSSQADVIRIRTAGPVARHEMLLLENPKRVVFDLWGCRIDKPITVDRVNGTHLQKVRVGSHPKKVRIAADLAETDALNYSVYPEGSDLVIRVSSKDGPVEYLLGGKSASGALPSSGFDSPAGPRKSDLTREVEKDSADNEVAVAEENPSDDVWARGADDETGGDDSKQTDWAKSEAAEDEDRSEKKSTLQLVGLVRNKFGVDLKEDNAVEDDLSNHSQFQAGLKYVPTDRFHLLLSMNIDYLQYENNSDWDYDSTIRFHNAYLNWSSSTFNLKVGNQILRWGKTDGYSPLDNLNPEDYRDGIAGRREDRKIPIPMVNLELYRGKFSIQGVYIPVFVEPELDTLGTDWAFFQHADQEIGACSIDEEKPSRSLNNTEGGIRLADTWGRMDFALSWFHGREDLPSPHSLFLPPGFPEITDDARLTDLLLFSRLTGQTVRLKHDWQHIYGLEMESTIGDFGVRGDVAYIDQSSFYTRGLQRLRKPMAQCMVGVDYNSAGGWYSNLQYLQSYILTYDSNILWADERMSAVNGTVSREFINGNLKPECRFYYDFSGNAAMLNPKVTIHYWDPLILEIGAELFDGSEETPVGIFGENDLLYVQVQVGF